MVISLPRVFAEIGWTDVSVWTRRTRVSSISRSHISPYPHAPRQQVLCKTTSICDADALRHSRHVVCDLGGPFIGDPTVRAHLCSEAPDRLLAALQSRRVRMHRVKAFDQIERTV